MPFGDTRHVDGSISVLLGNGDGTFQSARVYAAESFPNSITVGDFNGDGKQDLAVACKEADLVAVYLGHGDGSFDEARNIPTAVQPVATAIGDLNGDGKGDLVVASDGGAKVTVLLSKGDGTFQAATTYDSPNPNSIALSDLNGDGKLDLVVLTPNPSNAWVFEGNGDGTFQAALSFPAGPSPLALAVNDLDAVGPLDLAVVNNSGTVSVLLNACVAGPSLSVHRTGSALDLSWPAASTDFVLGKHSNAIPASWKTTHCAFYQWRDYYSECAVGPGEG